MAEQKLSIYDPADALNTLEAVAIFLADAFETGDAEYVASALGVVARAKGVAELAAAAGLERAPLENALSAGKLSVDATLAIMKVIDLHLPAS